jgi:hypothetical protein
MVRKMLNDYWRAVQNVNEKDKDNATPLHLASYYKRLEIVRVLLDLGAKHRYREQPRQDRITDGDSGQRSCARQWRRCRTTITRTGRRGVCTRNVYHVYVRFGVQFSEREDCAGSPWRRGFKRNGELLG